MSTNNTEPMSMKPFFKFMFYVAVVFFLGPHLIEFLFPEKAPAAEEVRVNTTAGRLLNAYENNEVSADGDYKDKWMRLSGTVIAVTKDLTGDPVVQVGDEDHQYIGVQCEMKEGEYVGSFSKGDKISVLGKCKGKTVLVSVDKCELVN